MTIAPALIQLILQAVLYSAPDIQYFRITVVDAQTGRGVPLVELKTVNNIRHYTDSNGLVAFHEPGLMDRDVFFFVTSHGYEFPADGFGMRGRALKTTPGTEARIEVKRINIAERLYRITGGGIYRDSVLTGAPVPIDNAVLNGDVLGQDSIQSTIYQGKIYWFWGDTGWPRYPLGNFHMSGATSLLPSDGGLDPDVGINLAYFVRENGFAKEMAPHPGPGPVWQDAFVTLPDENGRERMYAAYARVTPAMEAVERGFMLYNDEKEIFEKIAEFDLDAPVRPGGHPFIHQDQGVEHIWFPHPFPLVRVRADASAYLNLGQYEAWTPLVEGRTIEEPEIDRDDAGRIRYAWRKNTPALDQNHQKKLIEAGRMTPEEAWIQLQDVDTGRSILGHAGSVHWNEYRGRWITIRCEQFGTSMLGETWYAEADTPLGPWTYARKIVTHNQQTFYNPKHHPFFDKDHGRVIYFEGTYCNTFSGNPDHTPRYDYNQIMYKLDLSDERLALPVPIYCRRDPVASDLGTVGMLGASVLGPSVERTLRTPIAFYALDRHRPGAVAVRLTERGDALHVESEASFVNVKPSRAVFYALPADLADPPATTVPLYEYIKENGSPRMYAVSDEPPKTGYVRQAEPLCLVWRDPRSSPAP